MTFDTVFDVTQSGYRQLAVLRPQAIIAVLLLGLAGWIVVATRRSHRVPRGIGILLALVPALIGAVAFGVVALGVLSLVSQNTALRGALKAGRAVIVEGTVSDFAPQAPDGHGPESFVVSGHRYEYSSSVLSAAFNQISGQHGPIRNGLPVRIADVNGQIAKLEIQKGSEAIPKP